MSFLRYIKEVNVKFTYDRNVVYPPSAKLTEHIKDTFISEVY